MHWYLILDVTTGRAAGAVQARTERAAVQLGNRLFGWQAYHRAFEVTP